MSRNKLYKARIEICLVPEDKEELVILSKKRKVRVNQIIREIIERYLRKTSV